MNKHNFRIIFLIVVIATIIFYFVSNQKGTEQTNKLEELAIKEQVQNIPEDNAKKDIITNNKIQVLSKNTRKSLFLSGEQDILVKTWITNEIKMQVETWISQDCFLEDINKYYLKTGESSFTWNIEKSRPYINNFSKEYQLYTWKFVYSGSNPIFKEKEMNNFYKLLTKIENKEQLTTWDFKFCEWKRELNEKELLILKSFDYDYFVVPRLNLDKLWKCARNNYTVALIAINTKLLKPGDVFNVNRRLAHRIWYCATAENYKKYVFQSWVCGAATQVFRIWLIHPDLWIVERHAHRVWYSLYYGETIYGDDAGIIEFRKQMKLKNNSDGDIYFKYIDKWDTAYLVWVSEKKTSKEVKISKKQTWPKSGKTVKEVFDSSWKQLFFYERKSDYKVVFTWEVN